jgi:hypothetical protein
LYFVLLARHLNVAFPAAVAREHFGSLILRA